MHNYRALLCLLAIPFFLAADTKPYSFYPSLTTTPSLKTTSAAMVLLTLSWYGYTYLRDKKKARNIAKKRNKSTASIVYLFSHGIGATRKQALRYVKSYDQDRNTKIINTYYILDEPCVSFDYPDATTNFWRINFNKMNLGQEADIAALKIAYDAVCIDYPNARIVLVGLSRGASTIINFLSEYQPSNIDAVILESPFDNISCVIDHVLKQANLTCAPLINMGQKLISWISPYKPHGIQPIHAINKFPHSIPILFICSKEDTLVPASGTIALHEKLIESGHPNAHILVLKQGIHGYLLSGPEAHIYQSTVHAFYKRYNLAHDYALACQGESYLYKKRSPHLLIFNKKTV